MRKLHRIALGVEDVRIFMVGIKIKDLRCCTFCKKGSSF